MFFGESKTLKKLADFLRTELSAIQRTIKEHEGTITNASGAANEKLQEIARVVASGIRSAENEAGYEHAQRDNEYRLQRKIMLVTLGAFVAATVYAGVAIWQGVLMRRAWVEAKKTADASICAAKAAQAAIAQARTQFMQDQQPWLDLGKTGRVKEIGSGYQLGAGFKNYGRSPALEVRTRFIFKPVRTRSEPPAFSFSKEDAGPPSSLGSQGEGTAILDHLLSAEEFRQLNGPQWDVYIGIKIWYQDSWGQTRTIQSCQLHKRDINEWIVRNPLNCAAR
jgi:hypothetical protein